VSPTPGAGGTSAESEWKRRHDEMSDKYYRLVETSRNLKDDYGELVNEIEEHKKLRLDIAQGGARIQGGKNSTRKHQDNLFTPSDNAMKEKVYDYYQGSIWPHIKILPKEWEVWEDDRRSVCQRIMRCGIVVPPTYSKEEYWNSVVRLFVNLKKQSLHSGVMTKLKNEFKGAFWFLVVLSTSLMTSSNYYYSLFHYIQSQPTGFVLEILLLSPVTVKTKSSLGIFTVSS
jgi:hypothetical protein